MTSDVKIQDISFIEKIGNGNFSYFFKGVWNRTDEKKNIVAIRLQDIASKELIQKELKTLSELKHENVLKLYGITADYNNRVLLIMESADGGSFHNYLHGPGKENRPYKFLDVIYWMLQIANGCEYLHKMNPKSMDNQILTDNILLAFDYRTLKLVNFGSFSKSIDKFVKEGDVFCFGIILWELLAREYPFGIDRIDSCTFENPHPPLNDLKNDENSVQMKQVIEQCWNKDPKERVTMRSLAFNFGFMYQQISGKNKEVAWGEITLHKPAIGFGSFGDVYKATWQTKYGYKRNIVAKRIRDVNNADAIMQEIKYLSLVDHENIITLYGVTRDPFSRIHILTEYADCGSLYNYLHDEGKENRPLSDRGKLNWLLQFTKAVAYLHGMNPKLLHRDLKTHNILLANKCKTLKICDFGCVRSLATQMTKEVGTIAYMAPELANLDNTKTKQEYTEKCDVYSFGIILWEIMSREKPFQGVDTFVVQFNTVIREKRPSLAELELSEKLEYLKTLAARCWDKDPDKRPTMMEVAFILGVDPNSTELNTMQLRSLPQATDEDYNL
ncbi:hypothetical protein ACLKA7_002526 [Drosophila subpalustris]